MKKYTRLQAAYEFNAPPWELTTTQGVGLFKGVREYWILKKNVCGGPCLYRRDITAKVRRKYERDVKRAERKNNWWGK